MVYAMHQSVGAKPPCMDDHVCVFGQMYPMGYSEVCLQCLSKTRCLRCIDDGRDVFDTKRVGAKTHRDVS